MAKLDVQKFKEQLKKSQEEIEAELKKLSGVPEMGSDVDAFDTETDEAEEYSTNLGIKKELQERLAAIKKALEKIEAGAYGVCEKCSAKIPEEILKINPESQYCITCKSNH